MIKKGLRFWSPLQGEVDSRTARGWLLTILLLGLAFRVWGILWGLPGRTDLHPDEHDYVIGHALKLSFAHPDPGFLNYPAFLMYLVSLTFGALRHLHLISGAEWQAYLIGRLWSAVFGTLTALAAYLIARELTVSRRAALLASLWTALLPLDVWESHVAVTDPMMTFWTAMTLWASVRLVRTSRLRDFALAGACLGLATGSKYTAAMAVVAVFAGAVAARRPLKSTFGGLALAGIVSFACAFAVMPFSFLRLGDTLAAMSYEHHHTLSNHIGFCVPANGWQYHRYLYQMVAAWPFSMGFMLYFSAVAGTLWAFTGFDRRRFVLFAFAIVFFGITGSWHFTPLRYYLPLLIIATVFAGLWHDALLASPVKRVRVGAFVVLSVTLAYTLVFTAQTTDRYAHDTRVVAGRWLDQSFKPGSSLLVCGWSRYMGLPSRPRQYKLDGHKGENVFAEFPARDSFDLIEISSLHYTRHYRHDDKAWIEAYDTLRGTKGSYELVARFESSFLNKRFYEDLDPMFGCYFLAPTLEFYRPAKQQRAVTAPTAPAHS